MGDPAFSPITVPDTRRSYCVLGMEGVKNAVYGALCPNLTFLGVIPSSGKIEDRRKKEGREQEVRIVRERLGILPGKVCLLAWNGFLG